MQHRILIVDDDIELLKMLRSYFQIKGYFVIVAENGLEAFDKIRQEPDIILLDVNMPGIDGLNVCRQIRDMVSYPSTKYSMQPALW